jgi:hypothetical protein
MTLTSFTNARRLGALLATLLVAVVGASTGRAAVPRADVIRAQALDQRYGNAWTRVSSEEFRMLANAFGADQLAYLTPAQASADLKRAQALDNRYGNAWTRVSPADFSRLFRVFGEDTTLMTPPQARALLAQGAGMDAAAARYAAGVKAGSTASHSSFDWGDAGIGAAITAGVFLLGGAAALLVRRRRELAHLHR